jgi:membrane protein implicated in regulation of membrane protease activity
MMLSQISGLSFVLASIPETVALLIFSGGLIVLAIVTRRLLRRRDAEMSLREVTKK